MYVKIFIHSNLYYKINQNIRIHYTPSFKNVNNVNKTTQIQ
jgi:hypothetical protein